MRLWDATLALDHWDVVVDVGATTSEATFVMDTESGWIHGQDAVLTPREGL